MTTGWRARLERWVERERAAQASRPRPSILPGVLALGELGCVLGAGLSTLRVLCRWCDGLLLVGGGDLTQSFLILTQSFLITWLALRVWRLDLTKQEKP